MAEKDLENHLADRIRTGRQNTTELQNIRISADVLSADNLAELIGNEKFVLFQDTSEWNEYKNLMADVIGGMIPDIVIRSVSSGQNRIYIEVKEKAFIGRTSHESQVLRYLLHLLCSSTNCADSSNGMRRALLLAAPKSWFEGKQGDDWSFFVEHYGPLAKSFGIVLGRIYL